MSKSRSQQGRARGPASSAVNKQSPRPVRRRRLLLEALETRALLTAADYVYPYGATAADAGEYMLGDVAVNVVLMESNPNIWPYDNRPLNEGGRNFPQENWNGTGTAINSISGVKSRIQDGLDWWEETLAARFPNAPPNLLNFDIDWTYADQPVQTGYEPIARDSEAYFRDFLSAGSQVTSAVSGSQFNGGSGLSSVDDYYNGADIRITSGPLSGKFGRVVDYVGAARTFTFAPNTFASAPVNGNTFSIGFGWIYDFLHQVQFDSTGDFINDLRAYNDHTRKEKDADWAFTIFVVNDAADTDRKFAEGGQFRQAFAYPGGLFMVVPADREAKTYAHETGHQFWAMDEYLAGDSYQEHRGYYDTKNLNAANNVDFGEDEVQSIATYQGAVTGGNFSLTFNLSGGSSFSTSPLAHNASTPAIQAAINLSASGVMQNWTNGDISVTGGPLTTEPVTLTFRGSSVAVRNHGLTSINGVGLIGGSAGAITEVRAGETATSQQQDSIMAGDVFYKLTLPDPAPPPKLILSNAYRDNYSPPSTLAQIGWQDTDTPFGGVAGNGIFDVLDVPFSLSGFGQYNASTQQYEFRGSTHVNTLPNRNPYSPGVAGTKNDITLNQIRVVQVSIDGLPWQDLFTLPARVYSTDLDIAIPVDPGLHEIRIRSADTRTGVTSNVFVGETDSPTQDSGVGLGGVVFIDENTSRGYDTGERLDDDVAVVVTGLDSAPLSLRHEIEPDNPNYDEGELLNGIDEDAELSAIGVDMGTGDVHALTSTVVLGDNRVFVGSRFLSELSYQHTWYASRQLKVKFDSPVSTVSIRAAGNHATNKSYGRLEAYTANDTLVARVTTGPLTKGAFSTMSVSRVQGDIKYVVAYGHQGTHVVLDSLVWGPSASAQTNTNGAYSLDYLPDGTYRIHITPPLGFVVTTPAAGFATISVSGGRASGSVDFGLTDSDDFHPFHNDANRFNVDDDPEGQVAPNDALTIINYINAFSGASGEIASGHFPGVFGFIDVDDDGKCAPGDALEVINQINARPNGEGESAASSGGGGLLSARALAGEQPDDFTENAAEYAGPDALQVVQVHGTDGACSCPDCVQKATDELLASSVAATGEWKSRSVLPSSPGRLANAMETLSPRIKAVLAARKPVLEQPSHLAIVEEAIDQIACDLLDGEIDGEATAGR